MTHENAFDWLAHWVGAWVILRWCLRYLVASWAYLRREWS